MSTLLILVSLTSIVLGVLGRADEAIRLRQRSSMDLDGGMTNDPSMLNELVVEQVKPVEQSLRICNGYAFSEPLDVYKLQGKKKLTAKPIPYKGCRDMELPLQEGDQLDFRAGDLDIGTFYATGLPHQHVSLLLIPHRRDHGSLAMAFDSHAFDELHTAQIAVVDAYRGPKEGHVKLMDPVVQAAQVKRIENLTYSSVVALNPGKYDVALIDGTGRNVTELSLDVDPRKKYVAMRVGIDDDSGNQGFPMELVVFPSDGSGAACLKMFTALIVMVLSQALWL